MNDSEKLVDSCSFKDACNKALGITLSEDVFQDILSDNPISIDKLAESSNSLTELGTALIRLDALSTAVPGGVGTPGGVGIPEGVGIPGLVSKEVCFQTPFGEWCINVLHPEP